MLLRSRYLPLLHQGAGLPQGRLSGSAASLLPEGLALQDGLRASALHDVRS
jgi:hypothetical protein